VTPERRKRLVVALAVLSSATFALLAHFAIVDGLPASMGAFLSLIPLGALLAWAVRRSRRPVLAGLLLAAAAAALFLGWPQLERHFPDLFFVEHAGANLVLAYIFGRTLRGEREPMVTRFARLLHGALPPEVERYTRGVTLAWTLFFATLFTLSCALYLGGLLAAWSFLANIASPALIGAMFVVEYAVRLRTLPHWERTGVLGGLRAFSRYFASARLETPR